MSEHYQGSCHCGAIKFSYDGEAIEKAVRCTCSICSRKGAMMSSEAIPKENLKIDVEGETSASTNSTAKSPNIISVKPVAFIRITKCYACPDACA